MQMNDSLYRVIQEERSISWNVIIAVIVKKEDHMNTCIITNGYRHSAV